MKRIVLITPLILAASGMPAAALEFGDGFSATGEFELEYFDSSGGGSGEILGYGTADIAFQASSGFGGFVGFDAFSLDGSDEFAGYGALSYGGGFGKVQVGVPRAAIDDYLETPTLGGLRLYDLLFGGRSASIVTTAYLLEAADTPVGVRYDGTFGDLKVGASYHSIEDADIFDLAANYQLGSTVLRGGLEFLRQGGSDETAFHIGAETTLAQFRAGILYSDSPFFSSKFTQLYGVYSPLEQLNLTAAIWSVNPDSGDSGTLYGLSADYTFGQGTYVEGGLADGDDAPSVYNVSLGLKF